MIFPIWLPFTSQYFLCRKLRVDISVTYLFSYT